MKATETVGPVLIHIITEKGRGYTPAETASDKMHGVGKYDIVTGKQIKPSTKVWSVVFLMLACTRCSCFESAIVKHFELAYCCL